MRISQELQFVIYDGPILDAKDAEVYRKKRKKETLSH